MKSKLDLIKDEKIDLLTKVDRKNNEIESVKLTLNNLENHNEGYVKKLRSFSNKLLEKIKRMEGKYY